MRIVSVMIGVSLPSHPRPQSACKRSGDAFFWYLESGDDQALDLIAEILGN